MAYIEYKKNEYGTQLNLTLTDSDGNAIDLTGATVWLYAVNNIDDGEVLFSGQCVVTYPLSGQCYYTIQDGDLSEVGVYQLKTHVIKSGVIIKPNYLTLVIEPDV